DRVTEAALALGITMGHDSEDALRALRWGAYLHDVGKIAVPDGILRKPGKLDAAEMEQMRRHPAIGLEFGERIGFLPRGALDVILHHHERWDGGGYPAGLAGEAIPVLARIFAVCDVFDALVSERPYKRAWTRAEALAEIRAGAGTQFDARVVDAFVMMHTRENVLVPPSN
ncbi:MAG TPA: HD-GYP domain-containing protein, partial [Longimicrobium sp.]|nr:HD-GYP domain-containing protein [Longimicrobium sp.]